MKHILLVLIIFFSQNSQAKNYLDENLSTMNWNGIDVVWLEDDQYPTYFVNIYFYDGAVDDAKGKSGQTQMMFNQLTSGTTRYNKQEIVDALEFYGASYGANVTHEYSTFSVNGLVKDMIPTMKMICHTFKNATYPVSEFKKTKKRILTSYKNMVTHHSALANRIFRQLSLRSTAYNNPVSGTMKSLRAMKAKDLHDKLLFYNKHVKKRIYIKGPKNITSLKNVFAKDCQWGASDYIANLKKVTKEPVSTKLVYLVPIPKANQAQIRIGRYLTYKESHANYELKSLGSKYMGGGFTSRLMQELRVKRGLTYSVGAYASSQKTYGRSGISTFTKNKTLAETLKVINEVIEKESKTIEEGNFQHVKRFIKGNYLFGLESTSSFLETLLFFDHIGRNYDEIYKFPERIDQIKKSDLQKMIGELFNWNKQTKLVLGNKKLKKQLEKNGYTVKVLNYKDYL